ncbi:ethanolamine ammonia-lyase light chain [Burkholderia sp. SFA1]|uniref:ethanolamine ammonia-lyase subunit EutC n=1 Tax=unclassified Caballeronia TaxID=2646786 RepID=UPI001F47666F|nr:MULTISPECIES: ethanolamine ammonia-lyase subunit EutC [unclassified Caballeronia]MCE4544250.1 ethanolamine ammonia-lyase subunit EutC [Caballeronia sp. PC1]MCE4571401.1 ethanolamine ammonia-lyase subunit EutC [Caballeronia sp. CLC5]BBP98685.1 ethanolamine ammonia-lyase light chain [Burkholderia sp. SFA1]
MTNADTWDALRRFTNARIALGRAGSSLPTAPLLAFELAHAQARDAVHQPLDTAALGDAIRAAGFDTLDARSAAPDRDVYLRRPDLGRVLDDESARRLAAHACETEGEYELVFVAADGLSAFAAQRHAAQLLAALREQLDGWNVGPVVIATQARVALGDRIGELLRAQIVVVMIGERPGLSSPDSLGLYVTYAPRAGRHDAERNCISNVRPEGLGYDAAAFKLLWHLNEARRLKLTGVGLKDLSGSLPPSAHKAKPLEA